MRCLTLASSYNEANIFFATQHLEGNLNNKILENGYKVLDLIDNSFEQLDQIIKNQHIDLIVFDHYEIDSEFEKKIKDANPAIKILSIDDNYKPHYCDILLNHNIYADAKKYKSLVPKYCEIRCGEKYMLIREEFKAEREIKREKIYDLLLIFGGADLYNLNLEILQSIESDLNVAIITTTANRNLENLKKFIKDKTNIKLFINSDEVAKVINQSHFAITTASTTAQEVLYMKVPFIAIKIADNQADMYKWLNTNGYSVIDGFDRDKFLEIWRDYENR